MRQSTLLICVTIGLAATLNSATITMLAPVVLVALTGRIAVPRWVGVVGAIALIEQLVETITIFGQRGFIAPGGPMNVELGAGLVGLWLLCLRVTMARTPSAVA
jgi:hypothetical protein